MTDVYLFKNGVHQREVLVNGHRIHYLEAAPTHNVGAEKPVVLVHGLGARASDWAALIPALARHGYHVYAPDLLGYGRSDKPFHGDASLSTEERIVSEFIGTLALQKPDVAGWSMGGWIAAKLALDEPATVRRLLLFDTAGVYMNVDFPFSLFSPSNRQEFDELVDRIEPNHHYVHVPSFTIPGLLRNFQRGKWFVNSSLSSMLDGSEILDFRLHRLKMPLLVVWGTEDKLTPLAGGERIHALVPQSVLVELQGCGHLAIAECASTAIPPVIRFLDANPPLPPTVVVLPPPTR
ncbi:MAG: alpha/beta fold hydrolase [Terriglobus roseus]|nr:alpha/beta fold hydrolase [Terriglobus roseus]